MIISAILEIFAAFLKTVIGAFPTGTLSSNITDAIGNLRTYAVHYDFLNIAPTLVSVFVLIMGFEVAMWGVKAVLWVVRLIRGQ